MPPNLSGKLNEWRTEEIPVVAKTTTGEEFSGTINWFDNYNISLEAENGEVVLFKGAMTYIKPAV